MSYLCRDLKLSIQWINNNQLQLTLANDLSLEQVQLDLEVNDPPPRCSRRYENREAIIIGMRRLLSAALKADLISDFPGASMTSNTGDSIDPVTSSTIDVEL